MLPLKSPKGEALPIFDGQYFYPLSALKVHHTVPSLFQIKTDIMKNYNLETETTGNRITLARLFQPGGSASMIRACPGLRPPAVPHQRLQPSRKKF